ncbi:unnamed protein product [Mesocestoides corti]|uniref:Transcriptional activator protein Pur-alpha n=1 Tax=Mesocestoides corti TaxID=53468 RepID=A0A0R3UG79_MESCO|nr:unnamed protein product [Mesocestoides corti]
MLGSSEQRRRTPQIEEQELASKTIQIQNKRFYLDVKQNSRGRFIKITEVGLGGQKSRILMSVPAAQELRERLDKLIATLNELPPHNPKSLASDGLIESETIVRDNRRYYLDLRENERGRFLRASMLSMGVRVHIALPAEGVCDLRDALADLIKDYCSEEDLAATSDLPEAKVLFAGNKTFFFDVGSNRYGVFLRISELRANYRTAVTIPEHHWLRFRDILTELADKPDGNKLVDDKKSDAKTVTEQNDEEPKTAEDEPPAGISPEPTAIPVA